MSDRLMRSSQDKIIGGVCGGIGDYFDIDPVFVRIVAVVLAFAHGFGILAYIIAMVIIPKRDFNPNEINHPKRTRTYSSSWRKYLPGILLIIIGCFLLANQLGFNFDWGHFWSIAFIVIGLYLIFRWKNRKNSENIDINTKNHRTNSEQGGTSI